MLKTFDETLPFIPRIAPAAAPGDCHPGPPDTSSEHFCLLHFRVNQIASKHPRPTVVVAIPVCNEIERVERCVESLADQRDLAGRLLPPGLVRVLLLTNACTDGTYQFIEENMERWRIALSVYDVSLPAPQRNAGGARRVANSLALRLMCEKEGLLFMTDADSVAPPNWIATYSALLRDGYDAVAGLVDLHPDDCSEISPALCERGALEDRLTTLLDQIDSMVDPIAHDPWPRHCNASGANTSVRADALRGDHDFPDIACGEDRLFVKMLEARGRRIRHDKATRVFTSGRLLGRAVGGMADTLRYRLNQPDSLCDARLETVDRAYQRVFFRRQLRSIFMHGGNAVIDTIRRGVSGITDGMLIELQEFHTFNALWHRLEELSPTLHRQPITPSQLPGEIKRAELLMDMLSSATGVGRQPDGVLEAGT